jgi:enoyl-CoA hydratase/carnithine racemase
VTDELQVRYEDGVLTVVFDRPEARNAMTFAMYEGLHAACERADADDDVKVLVLTGAGKAFVAGTDITQFASFTTGQDGIEYELGISRVVDRLEDVTVPTVAVVRGACVGGGLALAAACDLRVASVSGRFGVPIARTLGNCLSMNTVSLLVSQLGPARSLDLLLRARLLTAQEAHTAGFISELADDDESLDEVASSVVQPLLAHAPLTMWAAKQAVTRLRRATLPGGDDFVARTFGSDDFHRGVQSFSAKERPVWQGR